MTTGCLPSWQDNGTEIRCNAENLFTLKITIVGRSFSQSTLQFRRSTTERVARAALSLDHQHLRSHPVRRPGRATLWSVVRHRASRRSKPKPRRFDLPIAAAGVGLGIPLITRDQVDFIGVHDRLITIAVG